MVNLQWQESPQSTGSAGQSSVPPPSRNLVGFLIGMIGGAALSMTLVGIVVGYAVGSMQSGGSLAAGGPSPQVVQAPPAPSPPKAPEPASSDKLPAVDAKTDHIRGDLKKATVAVIEYSDFECPFCKRVHPTYQEIMKTYGDNVVWVYRHFPLGFHANAQKQAEASDCVAELGGNDAFWKFTDYLFDKTTAGGTGFALDQLPVAAKAAGVDEKKFTACLDTGKFAKHVKDEMAAGASAGVQGTPGNFVVDLKTQKNQAISGAVPFSSFQSAIDAMLQ